MPTNTTNLSRRRLLASMPAAAVAAAPAAATALCRLPVEGDDPIFAVIDRHRQAFEEWQAAGEFHTQFRKEHDAQRGPGVYLGESPETEPIVNYADGRRCKLDNDHLPTGDGDTWSIAPTGRMLPVRTRRSRKPSGPGMRHTGTTS